MPLRDKTPASTIKEIPIPHSHFLLLSKHRIQLELEGQISSCLTHSRLNSFIRNDANSKSPDRKVLIGILIFLMIIFLLVIIVVFLIFLMRLGVVGVRGRVFESELESLFFVVVL